MGHIVNLTQHTATFDQAAAKVFNLTGQDKKLATYLLTFDNVPDEQEILKRAKDLAELAELSEAKKAMIGGAPFLMSALERELFKRGIEPVYAFSQRESVEEADEDGSVRKVTVFNHLGFVKVSKP